MKFVKGSQQPTVLKDPFPTQDSKMIGSTSNASEEPILMSLMSRLRRDRKIMVVRILLVVKKQNILIQKHQLDLLMFLIYYRSKTQLRLSNQTAC